MNDSSIKTRPTAIILVIGNEILNGKTLDTNSRFLADKLFMRGINVIRRLTIPDTIDIIIEEVRKNSQICDFLFSMGGIGPTPDDLTRQAFADAFNLPLVRNPEAERIMREYCGERINEIRLRMADLPENCELIPNSNSSAPGFIINNCFVFPGVPELLESMYEEIEHKLPSLPRFMKKMKTDFFEGDYADIMEEVQRKFPEVQIGSYPAFSNPDYNNELTFESYEETRVNDAMAEFNMMLKDM